MTTPLQRNASGSDGEMSVSLIFIVIGFMALQPIATDLYLASMPAIGDHFNVSVAATQLTLSIFIAGFAVAQLIAGPLTDRFGRRPVAIGGCALYVVSTLVAALAGSLETLIAVRFVQSVGTCCVVICARAIVRDRHAPEQAAQVMARALAWMALAPLTGPWIGGWLQEVFGWRANFVAIALAGALMLWAAFTRLPETNQHRNPTATQPRELAKTYLRIFKSAQFRSHTFIATGTYCALFSFISGSPFVAIRVLELPARHFGLLFGGVICGFLAGAALGRRFIPRWGLIGTIRRGALVTGTAGLCLLALSLAGVQSIAALAVPMFFVMVAHGLLQPSSQMGAIGPFPREAGAAAALAGFLMHAAAVLVGIRVGTSFDGTTLPLALTTASITTLTALGAFLLPALRERAATA